MNADLHSQSPVSGTAYGLHRGMTGTPTEPHKDSESFPFPTFSSTTCHPLQSYHELGCRDSPARPYRLCAKTLHGLRWTPTGGECPGGSRRKRELTPVEQKDSSYWVKRRRNNEAARRSRQRRRTEEILLETRAVELLRENEKLKATLSAVQYRFVPAVDHHEIPSNRLITKDCLYYPTTNQQLSHNYDISKDLFSDRFAYFANPLTPPHIDSYHTFSLSAASNVPAVTSPANVDPLATTLPSPRATLQKNEYSCSRNAATRREDTGHHFTNYVPGTFDFRQGCKLFQDMETTYSRNQAPASINHSDLCKNGAPTPRRLEQSTCNNYVHQQNSPSQQECCTVGSNYRENNAKDKLSTPKAQESGAHVQFLPHKLRFKATSTKVHTEQILNPNSARGRDEAVAENTSSSDSKATRPTNVGEAAQNATHFLNPRHTHFPETIQHQAPRRFSSLWGGSDRTVSTREEAEALENTRTRAPQSSGACAFSLFRQLSNNNDAGYYGTLCQGMQSAFPLEHERETGESGLRNQLASLGAEVKCLKQMLLAKSTA